MVCSALCLLSVTDVAEIDKSRSNGKKPLLGGSLFTSSSNATPNELQPLVPLQVALSKASMASGTSTAGANAEYDKMQDPSTPVPTPPVHAARLSQLLKALANAESSVSEVIKSRVALIDGLEKLLETNRSALSKEQSQASQLVERKTETESKKREVEDGIMKGLSVENAPSTAQGDTGIGAENVARPEVEALTPPPVEALTPVGSPKQDAQEEPGTSQQPAADGFSLPGIGQPANLPLQQSDIPGIPGYPNEHQSDDPNNLQSKRRKVSHTEEDYAQFASGDLDADVAELLAQEGNPQ